MKHAHNTDAQAVLKDLQEHMKSSSKGASEKRRLTQYVTNTVLNGNFKGTTEQFVLHFNEEFRQLDKILEVSELFSRTVKLIILQNAVRGISDLRIVETIDEFQSTTQGHGKITNIKYGTCYDLLINACVRHDKTYKSNLGKLSNIYSICTQNVEITPDDDLFVSENPWESSLQGIDTPTNEFYNVNSTTSYFPRSSRYQNTPRLPPNTSNHSDPNVESPSKTSEKTMGWTYLSL